MTANKRIEADLRKRARLLGRSYATLGATCAVPAPTNKCVPVHEKKCCSSGFADPPTSTEIPSGT